MGVLKPDIFDEVSAGTAPHGDIFDTLIAEPSGTPAGLKPSRPPAGPVPSLYGFKPGPIDIHAPAKRPGPRPGDMAAELKGLEAHDLAFPPVSGSTPPAGLGDALEAEEHSPERLQDLAERMGASPEAFALGFTKGLAMGATAGAYHPPIYQSEAPGATMGQMAGSAAPLAALAVPGLGEAVLPAMVGQTFLRTAKPAPGTGEVENPIETGVQMGLSAALGALPASAGKSLPVKIGTGAALGGLQAQVTQAVSDMAEKGELDPLDPESIKNTAAGMFMGLLFGAGRPATRGGRPIEYSPHGERATAQGAPSHLLGTEPRPQPAGAPAPVMQPPEPQAAAGDIFDQAAAPATAPAPRDAIAPPAVPRAALAAPAAPDMPAPPAPVSAAKPPERARSFPATLEENGLSGGKDRIYQVKANAQTVERASAAIDAEGMDRAIEDVLAEPRPSAEHTAKGILLIKRLQQAGDQVKASDPAAAEAQFAKAVRIASDLSRRLTEQGQSIQAASIVSKLSPDGVVLLAQRRIQQANAERLFPGKSAPAELTPKKAMQLREAAGKVQDLEDYLEGSHRVADILRKAEGGEALSVEDVAALRDYQGKIRQFIPEEARPLRQTPSRPTPTTERAAAKPKSLKETLVEAMDRQEQAARSRLKARGYRLYSGIPVDDLADFAIIGAARLAKSGIKFADWSSGMVRDFGETIKPHLTRIYAKAQEVLRTESARARTVAQKARTIHSILETLDTNTSLGADQAKALGEMVEKVEALTGEAKIEASQELQAALQSLTSSSLGQKVSSAQTIAQLLNPKTAVRNVLGNEIFFRMERISKYVATPIDWARSKVTGTDRQVSFATAGQGEYWKNFLQGARAAARGVSPMGIESKFDLSPAAFTSKKNPLTYLEKALGVELKAFDFASYMRAKNQTLGELATLRALNENVPRDFRAARIQKYLAQSDENLQQIADAYGRYVTFQDETGLSRAAQGLKLALNKATYAWKVENPAFGLGDLILKYPKTPANILLRAMDYSPAGFVRSAYLLAEPILKGGPRDVREIELALARAITGSLGFTGLGYYLADKGVLTGRAEKDRDARAFKTEQTGERNFQVNVSALERWVRSGFQDSALERRLGDFLATYDWAQPVSLSLATAATMNQAVTDKRDPAQGMAEALAAAGEAGLESLTEQPLLQGLADLFGGGPNSTAAQRLGKVLEGVPASFMPGLLNQIRQAADNTPRETYSPNPAQRAVNRAIAKLPFVASILPKAYQTLGVKPREQYQGSSNTLFNVFLNPAFVAKYKLDPVVEMVLSPYQAEGRTRQFPQVARREIRYMDPAGRPQVLALEGKDLATLQRFMGEEAETALKDIDPEQLAGETFEDQEKALAKAVSEAANRARARFLRGRGIQFASRDMKRALQAGNE